MKKPTTIKEMLIFSALATVAILVLSAWVSSYQESAKRTRMELRSRTIQADRIVKACRIYAMDWEGNFPKHDTTAPGGQFTSSTEAFNELIREVGLDDSYFYTHGKYFTIPPTDPNKAAPNDDGVLSAAENTHSYVPGFTDESPADFPLVADEMISPDGAFGEHHFWLDKRKAVVGYVGGQVRIEKLTSRKPGAKLEIDPLPPGKEWLLP